MAFISAMMNLNSKFLIFDLGGGTFDVSIVDLFEGVVEVKASTGDNYLGGEDFTQLLAEKFAKDCSVKMQDNAHLAGRLMAVAERCKQQLSTDKSVTSTLMLQDAQMPIAITEDELERIATPLLDRLRKPLERALRDARIAPAELKEVVLVGGATRMPIVRKVVTRMFGRFPNITVNPDFAIVQGAAIQAGLLASDAALDEVLLTDVCPYSMGVGVSEATQFGGQIEGVFSPIIERNTLVPVSRSKMYAPITESQTHLELHLYQGENRFVRDNILLGKLEVVLPRGKQDDRVVEVRFSYDVSGILEVDAAVLSSGKTSSVTLMGNANSLTPEEIDERRTKLALLKMHPRDEAPNKALMAKAERVYAEEMGERREAVGRAITEFAGILAAQDIDKIAKHRVQLEKWLDELDAPSLL